MGLFNRSPRRATKNALASAVMERLEDRTLLSVTLGTIADQTPPIGKPVIVAVNATDSSSLPVTFTADSSAGNVTATLDTGSFVKISVANFGDMIFQLLPGIAPKTVTNFLNLVNSGFYNGLQIPRVVSNFVIQSGSPFNDTGGGPGYTFDDEFNLGAIFDGTGQLAMANSGKDTNGSQFFVTIGQQRQLDFNHTIFGQLVSGGASGQAENYANGLAVLNAIDAASVDSNDVPNTPITMTSVSVIQDTQDAVFTINNTGAGAASVTIHAGDGTSTTSTSFNVTPAADTVNDPPILNPVKDQMTTTTSNAVNISLSRQDFENNTPVYSSVALGPTRTGDFTSGSAVISNVGNTLNLSVGMPVTSTAFTGTEHIASLTGNTITLNTNFTSTSTGVSFSFDPGIDTETVSGNTVTVTPKGGFIGIDHVLFGVADQGQTNRGSTLGDPYDKQAIDVYMTSNQSPDAVYVIQLYDQFLNRGVDAPSFTSRVADLDVGGSRVSEALDIETSHEAHLQDVNNIEVNYLGHEASVNDLNVASAQLDAGATIESVKELIVSGAEYYANAGGTNQGYVTALYKDFLNRLPDSNGESNFLTQLTNGTTRQQVAQEIIESPEARTFFVNQQYHRFLNRAPTSAELSASVALLNSGTTDEQVIANVIGSGEYLQTIYSNIDSTTERFVEQSYNDLLGRAPDPNGLVHFAAEAAPGTIAARNQVATEMQASVEFRTLEVNNTYQQLLHRSPDATGIATWVPFLATNGLDPLREAIINSPEFHNVEGGGTTTGYIQALYQDVLGRAAADSEITLWQNHLNNGDTTEAGMAHIFVSAPEYYINEINSLFETYLHRGLDANGQQTFLAELEANPNLTPVITGIIGSPEYYNLAQTEQTS